MKSKVAISSILLVFALVLGGLFLYKKGKIGSQKNIEISNDVTLKRDLNIMFFNFHIKRKRYAKEENIEFILNEFSKARNLKMKFYSREQSDIISSDEYKLFDIGVMSPNRFIRYQKRHPELIPFARSSSCNYKIIGATKKGQEVKLSPETKIGSSLRNDTNLNNADLSWIKGFVSHHALSGLKDFYVFKNDGVLERALEAGEVEYAIFYKEEYVQELGDSVQIQKEIPLQIPCKIAYIKAELGNAEIEYFLTHIKKIQSARESALFANEKIRRSFEFSKLSSAEWDSIYNEFSRLNDLVIKLEQIHFIRLDSNEN